MIQSLSTGLEKLGIVADSVQTEQLEAYICAVLEYNKTYNLMKAADKDEMAVNHVLDSLAALPHIQGLAEPFATDGKQVNIGDIGSGGGCPGIPLAVCFPQARFTLVERMEKRCVFLESVIRTLKLENTSVLGVQAQNVPPASFDIATFRAFHPFDAKIAKLLFAMLKPNGIIAAYKARAEKIASEMEAVRGIIPHYEKIPLVVPGLEDHERNLVVIQRA